MLSISVEEVSGQEVLMVRNRDLPLQRIGQLAQRRMQSCFHSVASHASCSPLRRRNSNRLASLKGRLGSSHVALEVAWMSYPLARILPSFHPLLPGRQITGNVGYSGQRCEVMGGQAAWAIRRTLGPTWLRVRPCPAFDPTGTWTDRGVSAVVAGTWCRSRCNPRSACPTDRRLLMR